MKQIYTIEIEKTNEEWAQALKEKEAKSGVPAPHTIDSILDAARADTSPNGPHAVIREKLLEIGDWIAAKVEAEKIRALATKDGVDLDILIGVV